jgi:hypothetical protein
LLLLSFDDLVDICEERVIQGREKERLQREALNPLGAVTSDRSGKSISQILQK